MGDYRPIPGDEQIPEVTAVLGSIDAAHLLVDTVTTVGAEAMANTGGDHEWVVIVELEGRFNRTDQAGHHKAILGFDTAMTLLATLHHTLTALVAAGGGPEAVQHEVTLEVDGEGWHVATCECGWSGPPCPDSETASEFYGDHRAGA